MKSFLSMVSLYVTLLQRNKQIILQLSSIVEESKNYSDCVIPASLTWNLTISLTSSSFGLPPRRAPTPWVRQGHGLYKGLEDDNLICIIISLQVMLNQNMILYFLTLKISLRCSSVEFPPRRSATAWVRLGQNISYMIQ